MSTLFSLDQIETFFHDLVFNTLQELFEKKHLYQSATVDDSPLVECIKQVKGQLLPGVGTQEEADKRRQAPFREHLQKIISSPWQFDTETQPLSMPRGKVKEGNAPFDPLPCFRIPTIRVACNFCEGIRPAHNSGFRNEKLSTYGPTIGKNKGQVCQVFTFPFQCQNCKGEPIFYLVRRQGLKFTITGRSHLEPIDIPKSFPKKESCYYQEAIIAHTAGRTLAGLFLLRVFIEQYMRRVTKTDGKIKGDELAERYASRLSEDFPSKFNSLKRVYAELSERLHSADASAEQFDSSRKDIEEHFDMLKLLPLRTDGTDSP